jgi:hypothetical protein
MTAVSKDSQIDLHLDERGRARLLIDNIDLSELVYRTEFVMEANYAARLVLHCHARNVKIHGVGDVVMLPHLRSIFGTDEAPSQA